MHHVSVAFEERGSAAVDAEAAWPLHKTPSRARLLSAAPRGERAPGTRSSCMSPPCTEYSDDGLEILDRPVLVVLIKIKPW